MKHEPVDLVERVVVGSVAVTARAIEATDADLTFGQWRVLLIVGETATGATVGEIAFRVGAQTSPASRLISRMKERGVVDTSKEDRDGRVTRVRLTGAGADLRNRVLEHRREALMTIISAASLSAQETEVLARLAGAFDTFA